MSSYPSRRAVKKWKRKLENEERNVENDISGDTIDVLNLPSRKEVHGRKRKKKNLEKQFDVQYDTMQYDEEDDHVSQFPPKKRRKKKGFPLVNILFFLFFIIVIIVATYPLWINKL